MSLAPSPTAGEAATAAPDRHRSLLNSNVFMGYLFISPWLIGFVIFTLFPFIASMFLSLTNWHVVGDWDFVGLANYQTIATGQDQLFNESIRVTFTYCLVRVPFVQIIALSLAMLLNQPIRGRAFFRTIFFLPAVTAGVATAYLWGYLFSGQVGLVNTMLAMFGIEGPNWLYSVEWSLPTLIILSCWNVGTAMLIYLAALQGVPESLHEAAMIDGAGVWSRFANVTVPMITPAIFFNLVLGIIDSFQVFTDAFIITNGGPGYSTLVYTLYLYRVAFQNMQMGYGSALAWILFMILLFFTAVQLALSRRWVYYEAEVPQRGDNR
jgi:multiple sugar transport system permease protein